jgi:hypothetical protein
MGGRYETETCRTFFHNQWQVGNFLPQKPGKAVGGVKVFLDLYGTKAAFGCGFE